MKYKEIFCNVSPSGISIITDKVYTPFLTGEEAIKAEIATQGNSLYSINVGRNVRTPIPMHTFYVNLIELLRQLGVEIEWHSVNPDMQARVYQELISGRDVRLILQKRADEAIGIILIPLDIDHVKNQLELVPSYDFFTNAVEQSYDLVKKRTVDLVNTAIRSGRTELTYNFNSKLPEAQGVVIKMKYAHDSNPILALRHMLHSLKMAEFEFNEPTLDDKMIILDSTIYPTDAKATSDSVFKNHVLSFVKRPVQDNSNLAEMEILLIKSIISR